MNEKSKYAKDAEQIVNDFKIIDPEGKRSTGDWLEENGLFQEASDYYEAMRNAKNRTSFDRAKLNFKKKIVRPYYEQVIVPLGERARINFLKRNPIMDFMSPKGLGSYDDIKKNEKVRNSKYATVSVNDKGEEVVNVPLLQMIDDPGELSDMAHYLEVDADELREHVLREWNKKKTELGKAEYIKMLQKIQAKRKKIADDFENSTWGQFGQFVAPEFFATGIDEARTGISKPTSDYVKAGIKDFAVDAASVAAPSVVGVIGKGGTKLVSHPFFQNAAAGLVDAGIEAGRQAMSDYYDMDWDNIKQTGIVSATVPSGIGGALAFIGQVPAGRKIARPFMKKVMNPGDIPAIKWADPPKTKLGEFLEKQAMSAVDVYSRKETMEERAKGPKKTIVAPSGALQYIMENDPSLIRMWEQGFVPSNPEGKALYKEWKEKFGGGDED